MRVPKLYLAVLLFTSVNAFSQDFVVPANYKLVDKSDYSLYEKDMIAAAKWLVATPISEQEEKRKEVSAFVVNWVNGSPTVDVEINETIFNFEKKNSGMLVMYMAACSRYVLETGDKDMRAKHRFALREMIKLYNLKSGIDKDKKMEKLIKADEEGKIDEWLATNLKIQGH